MGLALAALIVSKEWRIPPVWLPVSVFAAGTMASLFASGHVSQGLPQIKKFYVYSMLFIVTSAFRNVRQARWVALGLALAAALSAAWSLNQFAVKYEDAQEAHQDFYTAYVADRITGFTSHWMTFSGQMGMALLLIGSLVFFSVDRRWTAWLVAAGALISVALMAAYTRSVWGATACGAAYLIWFWRRWVLIALPVLIAIVMLVNPFQVRDRAISAFRPHGDIDSNAHRSMTRRIGYEMIRAHPWLGIGPEQVQYQYLNYLPPGTRLPLPTGFYGHLHNIYVHFAAELGVPTMLALLWIFARALNDLLRALRRLPRDAPQRWILHAAIACIILILVGGFYEKNMGDSHVLSMFLAILGCGYVAVREVDEKCKA
jgi:putative inorganic carbon (hco3(-)) transporter